MIPQNDALVKSKCGMYMCEDMCRNQPNYSNFLVKSAICEYICARDLTETKIQFYELQKNIINLNIQKRVNQMCEPTLDPVVVGEVIADFRRSHKMSQEVLSGLSAIGRTHLSAIERGMRKPTLETLYKISQALGVKMSEIVIEIENRLL